MRRCALGLIGLFLLVAPAARAADPANCQIGSTGDPGEEFNRLGMLAQPVAGDVEAWLGEQFSGFWLQARDGGWYLGIAPGPVTADQLRARALELVDARYDGEDEQRLRERLRVEQHAYGWPELRRIQDELTRKASERRWGVSWAAAISCQDSETWRVEFELFADATPSVVADARSLAEPYGDKVRVIHRPDVQPPSPSSFAPPARQRLRDLVRVRGCSVRLRPSARPAVRSFKVGRAGRRSAIVRIRFKDGRVLGGRVKLPSCRRR